MPATPTERFDEFLKANPKAGRSGYGCSTCKLKRRDEIDEHIKHYIHLRALGSCDLPWTTVVKTFIKPDTGYPYQAEALARHARNCLGLTV